MQLDQRDLATIQYVGRFGQLTASQIRQLLFADLTSHTPAKRTLKRLRDREYLHRIERRAVGGSRGGSGQYVYALGREGHKLFSDGRWTPARVVRHHSLAIADTYLALVRLQRQGKLVIRGYSTEPDCHVTIGRHVLKPDLYAELDRPDGRSSIRIMFEMDMGTQNQRQVTAKFVRYWQAREEASDEVWPANQIVLFVAVDEERAGELRWLLDKGDRQQRALFRVVTADKVEEALS